MTKKLILGILLGLFTAAMYSCSKQDDNIPDTEDPDPNEEVPEDSPRVFLWVDAMANWVNLSTESGIDSYVSKAKNAGVTDLIVDVKGNSGEVLYNSTIAPVQKKHKDATRADDYNYLGKFIQKAHAAGLKIHASMNVFAGGRRNDQVGIIYSDPSKAHWQSMTYDKDGVVRKSTETEGGEIMLNAALKEVRDYQLSIMKELAVKYPDLDGITFDHCRWDSSLRGDFSNESKNQFEAFAGKIIANFPKDIFEWKLVDGVYTRIEKDLFPKWNEWRCSVIYNFILDAKNQLKTVAPKMEFGDYVGAWYGSYYEVGVNWASNRYSPYGNPSYKSWSTSSYHKYGYAQLIDVLFTGNYSSKVTLEESAGWSVESLANGVNTVTMGDTKVFAGLYFNDYVSGGQIDRNQVEKAIEMCFRKSNGVMLFDVIYFELYDCWDNVKNGITKGLNLRK